MITPGRAQTIKRPRRPVRKQRQPDQDQTIEPPGTRAFLVAQPQPCRVEAVLLSFSCAAERKEVHLLRKPVRGHKESFLAASPRGSRPGEGSVRAAHSPLPVAEISHPTRYGDPPPAAPTHARRPPPARHAEGILANSITDTPARTASVRILRVAVEPRVLPERPSIPATVAV